MEVPEHMALADLKKAIKDFKTKDTPKLSSKKSVLSEYAVRVGILKSRLGQPPVEALAAPLQPRSEKKSEALPEVLKSSKAKKSEALPEVLKAPAPKAAKKSEAKSEAPKKKGSPFSAYMAAHKGKGYSMSQLAQMYKDQKE